MFDTLLVALAVAVVAYIGYILLRAYCPSWFGISLPTLVRAVPGAEEEGFTPPAANYKPAPAGLEMAQKPVEPKRVVAAAGPNPPNAAAPLDAAPTAGPDVQPADPYQETATETPIGDSMRHPERSFGPGVENTGTNLTPAGPPEGGGAYAPEAIQSGGAFMGSVFAVDPLGDDTYATA